MKQQVGFAFGDKKALYVDASRWPPNEIRKCLEEVRRASLSPGQRAIDTIVDEYNKRHAPKVDPPVDEVGGYRDMPRPAIPPPPEPSPSLWQRIKDLWAQFKMLVVRVFE